jgi:ATP-dependent Clp protease protease subunit
MEIKQLEPKEKVITFFGEIKSATVEATIKEIVKINLTDQAYAQQCAQWAIDNKLTPMPVTLTPIELYLSTYGGGCYDGLALYDVIEASRTPIEVVCTGKIMSMGIIVALGAKIRKGYRNTTFMIHQVSGVSIGTLRDMEETVAEVGRINDMLFKVIKSKTKITEERLNQVIQQRQDWFITAAEALGLGILTEII